MQISVLIKSSSESRGVPLAKLKALGQEVSELAEDIHRMSRQLHPAILDDLGLEAALHEECVSFSQQTEIPVDFQAEGVHGRFLKILRCACTASRRRACVTLPSTLRRPRFGCF